MASRTELQPGEVSPGLALLCGVIADTLRYGRKPQGETWTPEEIEREARLQRSIGRHKLADTLEAFLTEGRRAAVKRLPRTQKKRPEAARKVDARRRAWLALRDRLDPDHLEPIGRIHGEIDAVLSSYQRERWPLHKDRDSAPPRGRRIAMICFGDCAGSRALKPFALLREPCGIMSDQFLPTEVFKPHFD